MLEASVGSPTSYHYQIDSENRFEPVNTEAIKYLDQSTIIYQQRLVVYLGVSIQATGANIINQPANNVR